MAWRVPSSRLNSSLMVTGQTLTHSPQPVHFSRLTNRACLSRVTLKLPGSPVTSTSSVRAWTLMLACRPTSTSLGEIIHMAQSLVGKVLSIWAMVPPMAGPFSTK